MFNYWHKGSWEKAKDLIKKTFSGHVIVVVMLCKSLQQINSRSEKEKDVEHQS